MERAVLQEVSQLRCSKRANKERSDKDCADLSMELLIDFAKEHGLPVTFLDASGFIFCSKASFAFGPWRNARAYALWYSKETFTKWVQEFIQTKSLYKYNTEKNASGPEAGDLMMRYTTVPILGITDDHHTALVFAVYPPGAYNARFDGDDIQDFPGDFKAMRDFKTTRYFRGTTVRVQRDIASSDFDDVAGNHGPDNDVYFDYLNSRGKKNAMPNSFILPTHASSPTATSFAIMRRQYSMIGMIGMTRMAGVVHHGNHAAGAMGQYYAEFGEGFGDYILY